MAVPIKSNDPTRDAFQRVDELERAIAEHIAGAVQVQHRLVGLGAERTARELGALIDSLGRAARP